MPGARSISQLPPNFFPWLRSQETPQFDRWKGPELGARSEAASRRSGGMDQARVEPVGSNGGGTEQRRGAGGDIGRRGSCGAHGIGVAKTGDFGRDGRSRAGRCQMRVRSRAVLRRHASYRPRTVSARNLMISIQ
jgi:hypothetical protein